MRERFVTRRDSLDFRDRIYQPMLEPLAERVLPRVECIVLRDQGQDGACCGFGLAATIDYMNRLMGRGEPVSARMLYEMARHHDQWPGEDYEGSSARGTMKGWHKNGVCPESAWPYAPGDAGFLDAARQEAALAYPLGAYYRVLAKRSDLHAAINETGAVFVTAATHVGWQPGKLDNGRIPYDPAREAGEGHAFAVLGYTPDGFVIQNSWGAAWGGLALDDVAYHGCAIWSYQDFEANLWDAWVAQLALPVEKRVSFIRRQPETAAGPDRRRSVPAQHEIRDHYVHIDDGRFEPWGDYPSTPAHVEETVSRALAGAPARPPQHLVLYAHGGLNDVKVAAARAARWRPVFAANRIHELHFFWQTGLWDEIGDVLRAKQPLAERRAAGPSDWWDCMLERLTHPLGHALWQEMRSGAGEAFAPAGAGSRTLSLLAEALVALPPSRRPRVHLAGHSAGAVWLAHLMDRWREQQGPPITNLVLLAPACTTALFNERIYPALRQRVVERLYHFHLDDTSERNDDVAVIYRKSLLYLVSRSYEQRGAVVPLMGMERHLGELRRTGIKQRVVHYNTRDHRDRTTAASHRDFDNDATTMNSMLGIILDTRPRHTFRAIHLRDR